MEERESVVTNDDWAEKEEAEGVSSALIASADVERIKKSQLKFYMRKILSRSFQESRSCVEMTTTSTASGNFLKLPSKLNWAQITSLTASNSKFKQMLVLFVYHGNSSHFRLLSLAGKWEDRRNWQGRKDFPFSKLSVVSKFSANKDAFSVLIEWNYFELLKLLITFESFSLSCKIVSENRSNFSAQSTKQQSWGKESLKFIDFLKVTNLRSFRRLIRMKAYYDFFFYTNDEYEHWVATTFDFPPHSR